MSDKLRIMMVASENDAINGGKVGGIGDVLRDVPRALAGLGHELMVVTPSYGLFHQRTGARKIASVRVRFGQSIETIDVYTLEGNAVKPTPPLTDEATAQVTEQAIEQAAKQAARGHVTTIVLDHPLFALGGVGNIYCSDPPESPFASDANKFALFCAGVCEAIRTESLPRPDVLHLHDWHSAFIAILRSFDPLYAELQAIRCVFSIHNLALQGIRPFQHHASSLENWYPTVGIDHPQLADPRWPDCVNPMAAAIRLADAVHTVSPNYANEIQRPNDTQAGFHGGEGLEDDLTQCATQQRLFGILNGCDYTESPLPPQPWTELLSLMDQSLTSAIASAGTLSANDYLAHQGMQPWHAQAAPQHIVTSVGRLTAQKVNLLTHTNEDGVTVLEQLLQSLQGRGVMIILGSGEPALERHIAMTTARHRHCLFLNRYAQDIADHLYASGTLFLMPSSFEPCGISQMIAMKQGQPCLVHAVGGLADTVSDEVNGFSFSGDTVSRQAEHLVTRFEDALSVRESNPRQWAAICKAASAARFLWQDAAQQYVTQLYRPALT